METIKKTISDPEGNLMSIETTVTEREQSSVELTIDSKGNIKPTVKVYDVNIEVASEKAKLILRNLIDEYKIKISE